MRYSAGLLSKENHALPPTRKEFRPYRLVALELPGHYLCRANHKSLEDPFLRARKGKFGGQPQTAPALPRRLILRDRADLPDRHVYVLWFFDLVLFFCLALDLC